MKSDPSPLQHISPAGIHPAHAGSHGGYLIDTTTETVLYRGMAALRRLQNRDSTKTMVAVLPSGQRLVVQDPQSGLLTEFKAPGAVLLNPGCQLMIHEGTGHLLVIEYARLPDWYLAYQPSSFTDIHRAIFDHCGSDFDTHGLTWRAPDGGALYYEHSRRRSCWTGQKDDWIVSSIVYGGALGPPMVAVSRYCADAGFASVEPSSFFEQRPAERLHSHPTRDGNKCQLEVYVVLAGRAVLAAVLKDGPRYLLLGPGDMALVAPDVYHAISHIYPPYEQIVIQVPSTFQYGFWFKDVAPLEFEREVASRVRTDLELRHDPGAAETGTASEPSSLEKK